MGYEIIYSYHEKHDGTYNKEETKTLKKKVGDPFEEIPLEKLASSVMGQLARRDILVVGVEIFELTKKKVSFRETDNGVVIKNKKFSFDQTSGNFTIQELPQECSVSLSQCGQAESGKELVPVKQLPQNIVHPHEQLQNKKQIENSGQLKKPVDHVIFYPEPQMYPEVKSKGYRLTIDKKYAVYAKTSSIQGELFTIIDDINREIKISDKFFVPGNVSLLADNELNFSETQKQREGGNLYWGGATNDNMPNLRR